MAKQALMHIFRPGSQTTMAGATLEFSDVDLEATARVYDPAKSQAPICVGHPKHDMPAYGWIKSLRAASSGLFAEREQVEPQFAELCRQGRFKTVSAAFYPPGSQSHPLKGTDDHQTYYLRHVAMLGAQPPALKGLKPVEFSEPSKLPEVDDDELVFAEIEFSDPAFGYIARMFRGLRDHLIETLGLEKADQVLPDWNISSVEELGRERDNPTTTSTHSLGPAFSDPTIKEPSVPEPTQREKELQAQLDEANNKLQAQQEADARAKREKREADALAFAEGLVKSEQLVPADKAMVVAALCAVEGEQPVEFGEGDEKKPVGAALRELLGKLPKHGLNATHVATKGKSGEADGVDDELQFSERADIDPARLQMHHEAQALAKQKGISYFEAARQLAQG